MYRSIRTTIKLMVCAGRTVRRISVSIQCSAGERAVPIVQIVVISVHLGVWKAVDLHQLSPRLW